MYNPNRFLVRALPKGINLYNAKRQQWVYGNLVEYEPVVYCTSEDYEALGDPKKFYIITHDEADWGMKREYSRIEVEEKTIQQCTGLRDKDSKLVYEGDILHYTGGIVWEGPIRWDTYRGWYIQLKSNILDLGHTNLNEWKIVGHIHEL